MPEDRRGGGSQNAGSQSASVRDAFAALIGSLVGDAEPAPAKRVKSAVENAADPSAAPGSSLAALNGAVVPTTPPQTVDMVRADGPPPAGDTLTAIGAAEGEGPSYAADPQGKTPTASGDAPASTAKTPANGAVGKPDESTPNGGVAPAAPKAANPAPNTTPPAGAFAPSVIESAALSAANVALNAITGALGLDKATAAALARGEALVAPGQKKAQRGPAQTNAANPKGPPGGVIGPLHGVKDVTQVAGATAAFEGDQVGGVAVAEAKSADPQNTAGQPPAPQSMPVSGAVTRASLHPSSPLMMAALNFAERVSGDREANELGLEALGASLTGATARSDSPAVATAAPSAVGRDAAVPLPMLATEIARQAERGKKTFDIRLDPPELGKVRVKLDLGQEGEVRAHLIVERKETLDMLQRDQRVLERALQDAGLSLNGGGLQFSLSGGGQQQFGGDRSGATNRRSVARESEGPAVPIDGPPVSARVRPGGIDMRI